jgi:hypothetical protein
MLTRRPLSWIAAAALVVAALVVAAVFATQADEDGKEMQATATDLFSFVRALPADGPKSARIVPEEIRHDAPPAAQQENSTGLLAANAYSVEDTVRKMRAQGASDDEVYRARAAVLSAENAATLARLDREEAAWQHRVAAYQARRQAAGTDAQAIQGLRDELFSAEEQERLAAYEPSALILTGTP